MSERVRETKKKKDVEGGETEGITVAVRVESSERVHGLGAMAVIAMRQHEKVRR